MTAPGMLCPTPRETLWGAAYLAFELFLLPVILAGLNMLLAQPLADVWVNMAYFTLNLLISVLIFRRFLWHTLRSTRWSALWKAAGKGFLLYWVANFCTTFVILLIKPDFANVNDGSIAVMAASDFWVIALGTVVLVPVAEELVFRGVLFGGLYRRSPVLAWLACVVVFSAVHVVGYIGTAPWDTLLLCFLQYIPATVCLVWSYRRCGSILAPMLIHTAINAIAILTMR